MAIRLYRSNRTEVLAQRLAELMSEPASDPLAPEYIAVQGPGMERWLAMHLAQQFGVWANAHFPFPRAMLERTLSAALGPRSEGLLFDAMDMGWAFAQILQERRDDPALGPIHGYLRSAREADAWLTLGMRLGDVFDRYLVYRPELLLGFEQQSSPDDFQAVLWRALVERFGGDHPARRAQRYLQLADEGGDLFAYEEAFPQRVSLFGVSTLPPLFVRVLAGLSRQREVHIFTLAPSREYAGDLPKRQPRNDARALIGSLGRLSRDFQDVLEDVAEYVEPAGDLFVDPDTDNVLHGLQSDLLNLRSRGRTAEHPPLLLSPDDRSVRVHDCHSRTRELEVLRDQLLDALDRDRTLRPQDIVVLAPDIEAYAPAIETVFGEGDPSGGDPLPYRIADREPTQTSEVSSSLLTLLNLVVSRVSLSEVSDLLHRPLVHGAFELSAHDVATLVRWLDEAGARWGVDGAQRAEHGQPPDDHGSLQAALHRLLLGHAMAADGEPLFGGTLPYDDVEGESERLERLARFVQALSDCVRGLAAPRPVEQWCQDVGNLMDRMLLDAPEAARERQLVRDAMEALRAAAGRASCETALTCTAFRQLLERQLGARHHSHGFLHGGVTFCRHVPMRALPFRVVCLLGLDDDTFPRRIPQTSFDRTATSPRRGDRTPADDDRQVFLEALLSARDMLIITHRGHSIEDNSVRPRAAVVDQLLDVIEEGWMRGSSQGTLSLDFEEGGARSQLVREHPLWPFDARYFEHPDDPEWFTYDALAQRARESLSSERHRPTPFFDAPLASKPTPTTLELSALLRFVRNPPREFLRTRLGIILFGEHALLPDREPLLLGGLDRWKVAEYLRDDEREMHAQAARLWARAQLPLGDGGRHELQRVRHEVRRLRAEAAMEGVPRSIRIDVEVAGVRLVGRVDGVFDGGRSELTMSSVRAKHLLEFWVRQLAVCAMQPLPGKLVGKQGDKPKLWQVEPITEARDHLARLLEAWKHGAACPLPFYPEASYAFTTTLTAGGSQEQALERADKAFAAGGAGAGGVTPECESPALNQLYGYAPTRSVRDTSPSPLPPELSFEALAQSVFGPLLRHLREDRP